MEQVIKRINLDVYSSDFKEIIRAQQGDNLTRMIEFALYNQNEIYTIPTGITVKIEGHRGDKSMFSKNCTYSGNIVSVELDDDILLYSGMVEAKVVMYDYNANKVLSSVAFRIEVQEAPCDTNAEVEQKSNLYNDLVADVQRIEGILTGKMHICGIRTVTLNAAGIASGGSTTINGTFSSISRATSYLIIPYNFSYCTPQSSSVSNNILTATLHNVTASTQNLSASFYIIGYA